jgi:hypothetical protein
MKIKSILVWPDEVCLGWAAGCENYSDDTHHDQNSAVSVCETLIKKGFGCEGEIFPIAARVEIDKVKVFEWTKNEGFVMVPERQPSMVDLWTKETLFNFKR